MIDFVTDLTRYLFKLNTTEIASNSVLQGKIKLSHAREPVMQKMQLN